MTIRKIKISKEEYENNINKTYSELNKFMIEKMPIEITCGYGFYGGRLTEDNGEYFIAAQCGSSCD